MCDNGMKKRDILLDGSDQLEEGGREDGKRL